jgi:hypothetical protein
MADISNLVPGGAVGNITVDYTFGYSFTVGNAPLTVSSLGVAENTAGGSDVYSHQVTIWNSSGTQLATVTVPAGTAITNQFEYIALGSSLTLAANTQYTIGATYLKQSPPKDYAPTSSSATGASGLTLGPTFSVFSGNTFGTSDALGAGPYYSAAFLLRRFSFYHAHRLLERRDECLLDGRKLDLRRRRNGPDNAARERDRCLFLRDRCGQSNGHHTGSEFHHQ